MTETISKVRLERVTKMFEAVRALSNVSFEVNSGEVVAVMGKNGAGKSTLLSILSLIMRPSRGKVLLNEKPAHDLLPEIYGKIGLLSHLPLVYPDLTCRENLILIAKLHGVESPEKTAFSMEKQFDMEAFANDRPTRVLSRGQLQRVALARSLIAKPDLLLLDEPAAGLDSDAVFRIDKMLKDLTKRGGMAVVVTHEPEVASRVATRAIMIRNGEVASDTNAPLNVDGWKGLYNSSVEGREV